VVSFQILTNSVPHICASSHSNELNDMKRGCKKTCMVLWV